MEACSQSGPDSLAVAGGRFPTGLESWWASRIIVPCGGARSNVDQLHFNFIGQNMAQARSV